MTTRSIADLPFQRGDSVCLLINDLGATTMMELLIVNRRVCAILREYGIEVYDTLIGNTPPVKKWRGFRFRCSNWTTS